MTVMWLDKSDVSRSSFVTAMHLDESDVLHASVVTGSQGMTRKIQKHALERMDFSIDTSVVL